MKTSSLIHYEYKYNLLIQHLTPSDHMLYLNNRLLEFLKVSSNSEKLRVAPFYICVCVLIICFVMVTWSHEENLWEDSEEYRRFHMSESVTCRLMSSDLSTTRLWTKALVSWACTVYVPLFILITYFVGWRYCIYVRKPECAFRKRTCHNDLLIL